MLASSVSETLNGNSDVNEIWPKLDVLMRVGETLSSRDDPDHGQIIMDKSKVVTTFSWVKKYV
jgi:hypothetical protein